MQLKFSSLLIPAFPSGARTAMKQPSAIQKGSSLVVRPGSANRQKGASTTTQARTTHYFYLALTCLYPIIALVVCLILFQAVSEWMADSSPFLSLPTSKVP